MSAQIQISKSLHLPPEFRRSLRKLLNKTVKLTLEAVYPEPEADLSLVLSGDDQLQELNRGYRGIDAVTDVLSFPSGETDPETGRTYLGDILISYSQAFTQAAVGGHPVEAELQLLAVHGVLHLCGYDHAEPEEKSMMWKKQAQVLRMLECPITAPEDPKH